MILYIDSTKETGPSACEGIFVVKNTDDAIETIKLMQYLQQFRPEKEVLEHISMDDSEISLAILAAMEAHRWNYQLVFRKQPTNSMQQIMDRNTWSYTIRVTT